MTDTPTRERIEAMVEAANKAWDRLALITHRLSIFEYRQEKPKCEALVTALGAVALEALDNPTPSASEHLKAARAALNEVTECPNGMCGHCIEAVFEDAQPLYEKAIGAAEAERDAALARAEKAETAMTGTGVSLMHEENERLRAWQDDSRKTWSRALTEAGIMREALTSIAASTCCGSCQEAALVARTALDSGNKP